MTLRANSIVQARRARRLGAIERRLLALVAARLRADAQRQPHSSRALVLDVTGPRILVPDIES